jgi:hypothetical protein
MTPRQSPNSQACLGFGSGAPQRTHGEKYRDRLPCLIVLASLVVIVGGAVFPALAQPLDPESLIGVWSGRVTAMDKASVNLKMVLTIRRVAGGEVFGLLEMYPHQRPIVSRPFRGTLEGNELRVLAWRLTVFPRRMTGRTNGGTGPMAGHGGAEVELTKE